MPKISQVNLLKKIKIPTANGATWVFAPALFDSKGRVRRDHVLVTGKDEPTTRAATTSNGGRAGSYTENLSAQMLSQQPTSHGQSRLNWTRCATELSRLPLSSKQLLIARP